MNDGVIVLLFFGVVVAGIVYVIWEEISTAMKIKSLTHENESLKRQVEFYSRAGVPVHNQPQK